MINNEIARAFERAADLLEIDGAQGFRINSYRRAARTLKDCTDDVAELMATGQLEKLPGIGKGTAGRITKFIETGHVDVLDELEAKLPSGLPQLLEIQGLGPKKVAQLYHDAAVTSLADLKGAIASGKLDALKGFGKTSIQRIADGIAFLESSGGRTRLGETMMTLEKIAETVGAWPDVERVAIAGSVRRGRETSGDGDLLCAIRAGASGKETVERFVHLDPVTRVLASGTTKGAVVVPMANGRPLQVDLRVVEADSFGAAWQYFTGSKEHNVRLREWAVKRGWRLNEYGLFEGEQRIAGKKEAEVYARLGLQWIPPELREDRYEFGDGSSAVDFDDLVSVEDIRGDLHMHTVASDGKCTIDQMAEAAHARGYEYIAICDHSRSSTIANGLSIERMEQHLAEIRRANGRIDGIEILAGCECDILPDGSMDYPEELLAQTDWVVASIHAAMGPGGTGKLSPTERTLAAMENRYVSAIGHPTGRLINKRAPMEMDMHAVIAAAKRTATLLEINASWYRLDLKDTHVRQAIEGGVMLTVNTDAHHTDSFDFLRFGIMTARRGTACKSDIVNTMTLAGLRQAIARKREG
ncbi:MAG: DNA polymerase/3'-5' exonuclease PolX [Phycisphaerae bacterium]